VDLADFYGVSPVELREANESQMDVAHRVEVLDDAVSSLDATIREQFSAIYEALGMSRQSRNCTEEVQEAGGAVQRSWP
jgi:hypothetical protein